MVTAARGRKRSGSINTVSSNVSEKGADAFAVLSNPNCALFRLDRTNTNFAAGAGVQVKFCSWAARAEYERFNAAGGNPSLVSLGLTRKFL
jgi:opacity protein-like surface antigen